MPLRKIASNYLWTPQGFVRDPLVEVGPDGRIVSVGCCGMPDRSAATEFYAGVLIPGFVNAHCHLELSALRDAIPEGCGFAGFAAGMGAVRNRFDAEACRAAMQGADAAMWQEGIVAVGDVANGAASFEVKSASRMTYHTFVEFFGLRAATPAALQPLLRRPNASLTPHSLYSVQDAPFRSICAAGTTTLSIHFLESPAEAALFEGRGPLHEWYAQAGFACDFLGYGSPTERLVQSIPPDRKVMLVHGCCAGEADVRRIGEHFTTPVHWCLCPRSNHYISRLRPPVDLLRSLGASICVGTDSLASNSTLSMLDELKTFENVPLHELLRWATLGGAEALDMTAELGTVEPGKRPGLNVLWGLDYDRMALLPGSRVQRLV